MISNQSVEDFRAICKGIIETARVESYGEASAAKMRAVNSGSFASSRTLIAVAQAAVAVFERHAPRINDALFELNRAEPVRDASARREQLRVVLEEQIRALGAMVQGMGSLVARPVIEKMGKPAGPLGQIDAATERAVIESLGRIGLAVAAQSNQTAALQAASISITNHGTVASIQAGNGNTANVTQSVVTQVSPGEVKAALDVLIQALQQAQGLAPDQRAEVVEVLEQVKAEADKDKPNKLKLGGLIGSVRDVLEGLQAAPGAWETVKGWYAFIAANAAQAAPAIGQALQNFGN